MRLINKFCWFIYFLIGLAIFSFIVMDVLTNWNVLSVGGSIYGELVWIEIPIFLVFWFLIGATVVDFIVRKLEKRELGNYFLLHWKFVVKCFFLLNMAILFLLFLFFVFGNSYLSGFGFLFFSLCFYGVGFYLTIALILFFFFDINLNTKIKKLIKNEQIL